VPPPKVATPIDSTPPKTKDSQNSDSASPEGKTDSNPPKAKKPEDSVKTNTPADMTPQIKERAYEIYEERGHHPGEAGRDWAQAEQQIGKFRQYHES